MPGTKIRFHSFARRFDSLFRVGPLCSPGILALLFALATALLFPPPATTTSFKPHFVDINPDDSGPQPECSAPCPSGGSGGRVHRLASSKGRPNEVYATSELGGLFKTSDLFNGSSSGFEWHHLDGHLPTKTWDVAVDPYGDIVYATSLYDGRVHSLAGIEVSGDGGQTWTHPPMTPPLSCSAGRRRQPSAFGIAIRPNASNEVLAGTNCGIARSEDHGGAWEIIDPTPATPGVRSVFDVVALPGGLTYACGQDGVMRSPNGKTGWQKLPAPLDSSGRYAGYCSMAVHPDFPQAIFVVFARTTYFDSIFDIRQSAYFASLDGGQTWSTVPHPDGSGPKRVPMVAVNRRSDGLDVWLGAGNLFRMPCIEVPIFGLACPVTDTTKWKGTFTDAGGFKGFPRDLQKAHGDTGDVLFDPSASTDACLRLYSSDGGVYFNVKDEQPGCHDPAFLAVNTGLHAELPLGMAGAERSGSAAAEDIYMALQDNGFFATLNAGAAAPSWIHGGGADWFDVVADATQVIASNGVLNRGDPGFVNAVRVPNTPGPATPFFVGFTDAIAQWGPSSYVMASGAGPDVLFTSDLSAQTVQNKTVQWTSLSWPSSALFPCGVRASRGLLFSAFYVMSGDQNSGACLWRNQNQLMSILPGANPTWKRLDINTACPNGGFGIFAADPVRPGRLYASCTSEDPPLMVRTEDGGGTWQIDQSLTDLMTGPGVFVPKFDDPDNGVTFAAAGDVAQPAIAGGVQPAMVAFDPNNANLLVAGGYESGVFLSSDGGKGWALLSDPFTPSVTVPHLPRPFYAHFAHNPDGSLQALYIGSVGRGVWRIEPATTNLKLKELIKLTECNGPCPPDPCLTCSVAPGEKLDWEAQITNSADAFAGNLVFQHTLPEGLAFRSVDAPAGWICSTPRRGGSGLVRCTASSLEPGAAATIIVRTHVTKGPGRVLESEISIVSNAIDPDPEDNRVMASNMIRTAGPPRRNPPRRRLPRITYFRVHDVDHHLYTSEHKSTPKRYLSSSLDTCPRAFT
jgi:hypothetical protein